MTIEILPSVCPHDCPSACALEEERSAEGRLGAFAARIAIATLQVSSAPKSPATPSVSITRIGSATPSSGR